MAQRTAFSCFRESLQSAPSRDNRSDPTCYRTRKAERNWLVGWLEIGLGGCSCCSLLPFLLNLQLWCFSCDKGLSDFLLLLLLFCCLFYVVGFFLGCYCSYHRCFRSRAVIISCYVIFLLLASCCFDICRKVREYF